VVFGNLTAFHCRSGGRGHPGRGSLVFAGMGMSNSQRSKRARAARRAACWAGLPSWVGHRSHVNGRRWRPGPGRGRGDRRKIRRFGHNYQRKLARMLVTGEIDMKPGMAYYVSVFHDDRCGIWSGLLCNCKPEIKFSPMGVSVKN
jgi:hypothetical protein